MALHSPPGILPPLVKQIESNKKVTWFSHSQALLLRRGFLSLLKKSEDSL